MYTLVKNKAASLSIFLLLCLPMQVQAESGVLDQLKTCARTEDNSARSQCYEALGKQVLETEKVNESASEEPAAAPAVAGAETTPAQQPAAEDDSPKALPDTAGGREFNKGAEEYVETYTANLNRCQRASDRKWFYVFDNGQIWKQVDRRKLRHKNCTGNVAIAKDGFGYKMEVTGIKGWVRIRRHK